MIIPGLFTFEWTFGIGKIQGGEEMEILKVSAKSNPIL